MKNGNIKRNKAYEIEKKNRKRLVRCVIVLALIISVALTMSIVRLRAKNQKTNARITELTKELESEYARSKELDQLEKDVKSDEYAEKVAREKFNLCYPDEIIFTPDK